MARGPLRSRLAGSRKERFSQDESQKEVIYRERYQGSQVKFLQEPCAAPNAHERKKETRPQDYENDRDTCEVVCEPTRFHSIMSRLSSQIFDSDVHNVFKSIVL